jgi:hypothetical protein
MVAGLVVIVLGFVVLRSFAGNDSLGAASTGLSSAANGRDAKAAFIEEADALCARATLAMKRIAVPPTSPELLASIIKSIEINQKLQTQMRTLKFPFESRRLLKRMMANREKGLEVAKTVPVAMSRGDARAARTAVERTMKLQKRVNELARRYGFEEC